MRWLWLAIRMHSEGNTKKNVTPNPPHQAPRTIFVVCSFGLFAICLWSPRAAFRYYCFEDTRWGGGIKYANIIVIISLLCGRDCFSSFAHIFLSLSVLERTAMLVAFAKHVTQTQYQNALIPYTHTSIYAALSR